jgi:hypothetical protein
MEIEVVTVTDVFAIVIGIERCWAIMACAN